MDVLVLIELRQLASAQDLKTRTIVAASSPDPGVSLEKGVVCENRLGFRVFFIVSVCWQVKVI